MMFNRRAFIKVIATALAGVLVLIWAGMLRRNRRIFGGTERRIKIDSLVSDNGIQFAGEIIVYKKGEVLRVFSSTCTHAGCRISHERDGILECPCHGSAYSAATGSVVKGPAVVPLKQLPFTYNRSSSEIVVQIG